MMQDHTGHNIASSGQTLRQTPEKPVVLIGMMGTGKTQIGRELAKATSLPFFDTDQEFEAASGYSITDYFARFGEEAFRAGEYKVMERLLDGTPKIVASGGGIVVLPQTRALLREKSIPVWLTASPRTLAKRCEGNNKRPLLQNGNAEDILAGLLQKRSRLYEETACFSVSTERVDDNALQAILKGLETCQAK